VGIVRKLFGRTAWGLLFGGVVIGWLFFGQMAFATDYIFFAVNGDTAVSSMMQGDELTWVANCGLGETVNWEIWFDANSNSAIDPSLDVMVAVMTVTDGDALTENDPIRDGWAVGPSVKIGLEPGPYIFKATNLYDFTVAQRILTMVAMSSPPNRILGTMTIPGHPAPDPLLTKIPAFAQSDTEEEEIYIALADQNGNYTINIGADATGVEFFVGSSDVGEFVAPDAQAITVSGVTGGVDFTFISAVDSVYGFVRDDEGTIIPYRANVYVDGQNPGTPEKEGVTENGRYVVYFSAAQHGDWELEVSSEDFMPGYMIPDYVPFSHDTLGSFQYDFSLHPSDTVIYARVTENGGPPAHHYSIAASSPILSAWTRGTSGPGSDNIAVLHVSSLDMDSWNVWIQEHEDDAPIPPGLVVEGYGAGSVSPGDTVDLNLVNGELVSDVIVQDPEDAPIAWNDVWIDWYNYAGRSYGDEVGDGGVYGVYVSTGTYFVSVNAPGYMTDPAYREVVVDGDTTGGLGFIINQTHCHLSGTLLNVQLPLSSSTFWVSAQTGSDGYDGYIKFVAVDSATGVYEMDLCDGEWTITPPYIAGYMGPSAVPMTIGEAPDNVRTQDFDYSNSCGDANGDMLINVGDAVFVVNYVFKDGPWPNPLCTGDANHDGLVNVGDAIYVVNYVFKDGPDPIPGCCD